MGDKAEKGSKGKVALFGIGRLGLCTALCLERAGYSVLGVDVNDRYIDRINRKTLNSPEPSVNEMLAVSTHFHATSSEEEGMEFSDIIMIVVATPSTGIENRHYDHSALSAVLTSLNRKKVQNKHVVICCTVLPGYCRQTGRFLLRDCINTTLSYNPEFIAQGDVINGLLRPDMVLIGQGSEEAGDRLESMYISMCDNKPHVHRMSPESAEITKLAVNCFITTKIAFANMVADIADRTDGADKHQVLSAVGADTRIGVKYLRPGYGFGGPCFPRDNRALGAYAKSVGVEPTIPTATDEANRMHTQLQAKALMDSAQQEFEFTDIGYKEKCTVPIIEESQKLVIAATLARAGRQVTIRDTESLILAVQQQYGSLFRYVTITAAHPAAAADTLQPHAQANMSRAVGGVDSYGLNRLN